jgi:inosine-uridine nucleoside N-ribohydrolase
MSIYDPTAALIACQPDAFVYQHCDMTVSTVADATYGKTTFKENSTGSTRLVIGTTLNATDICLDALTRKNDNVD